MKAFVQLILKLISLFEWGRAKHLEKERQENRDDIEADAVGYAQRKFGRLPKDGRSETETTNTHTDNDTTS